jgi:hypothetical protein
VPKPRTGTSRSCQRGEAVEVEVPADSQLVLEQGDGARALRSVDLDGKIFDIENIVMYSSDP